MENIFNVNNKILSLDESKKHFEQNNVKELIIENISCYFDLYELYISIKESDISDLQKLETFKFVTNIDNDKIYRIFYILKTFMIKYILIKFNEKYILPEFESILYSNGKLNRSPEKISEFIYNENVSPKLLELISERDDLVIVLAKKYDYFGKFMSF